MDNQQNYFLYMIDDIVIYINTYDIGDDYLKITLISNKVKIKGAIKKKKLKGKMSDMFPPISALCRCMPPYKSICSQSDFVNRITSVSTDSEAKKILLRSVEMESDDENESTTLDRLICCVTRCFDSLKDLLDVTIEYKKVVEKHEARSRSRSTVIESRVAELERDVNRLKNTAYNPRSTSLVDRLRRQEGCTLFKNQPSGSRH